MSTKKKTKKKLPSTSKIDKTLTAISVSTIEPKYIILHGNPIDGLYPIGPFNDHEEALEYAENLPDQWNISELYDPLDD